METETIDRLFLELSQFMRATTANELALRRDIHHLLTLLNEARPYVEAADGTRTSMVIDLDMRVAATTLAHKIGGVHGALSGV